MTVKIQLLNGTELGFSADGFFCDVLGPSEGDLVLAKALHIYDFLNVAPEASNTALAGAVSRAMARPPRLSAACISEIKNFDIIQAWNNVLPAEYECEIRGHFVMDFNKIERAIILDPVMIA